MRGFIQVAKNTKCLIGANPDKNAQNHMCGTLHNPTTDYARM